MIERMRPEDINRLTDQQPPIDEMDIFPKATILAQRAVVTKGKKLLVARKEILVMFANICVCVTKLSVLFGRIANPVSPGGWPALWNGTWVVRRMSRRLT